MSSTYPHKAHSFSLNPSNCSAPGVGGALNHCHTREEQVQVGSWDPWVLETKRARSLQRLFQEGGGERHLGTGRLGETMEPGALGADVACILWHSAG